MNQTAETVNTVLNATDRCDQGCGAAAKVRVVGLQGHLDFCGHHYAKHETALTEWGFDMIDERDTLNHKPGASAF